MESFKHENCSLFPIYWIFGEHNKKVTTVHVALLPPMLHNLCKMICKLDKWTIVDTTSSMLSKRLFKEARE